MVKRKNIDGILYTIIDCQMYVASPEAYDISKTAILDRGYVLPIRNMYDQRPGVYFNGPLMFYILPDPNDEASMRKYSTEGMIDFDNINDIRSAIETQAQFRDTERYMLTTPNNIFTPIIADADAPEMKAIKQMILDKHIDIDKYADRFNSTSNLMNDKRMLEKGSITYKKTRTVCKALDVKATLILEDASPDVPNPIGHPISIEITSGGDEDE